MAENPQPIEAFKFGNFDFAMWNNQSPDQTTFQTVTIKRNYRDQQGNWQSEEMRLLPQQLNDLALASQDMYRLWRHGMKQRRQQADRQSHKTVDGEQPAEPEQGEASELGSGTEGKNFREKVNQTRGSRRSR
jgi:hypothetical protein